MVGLQFFLSSRLRTQPFAAASRAYPMISVPMMVPNTQYLLDGIVWSLNDHPTWAVDAWLYVLNYLRDAAERFDETVMQLDTAIAVRQRPRDSRNAPPPSEGNAKIEREQTYMAHAAVQDVYVAFCVVDAMLKGCTAAPTDVARARGAQALSPLRVAMEKELPRLVSDYFPIFAAFSADNTYVADALEEYRLLFLGLLESWAVMRALEPHTIRRLEEHIRYKLKNTREGGGDAVDADTNNEDGRGGASTRAGAGTSLAVQQSLEILLRGTLKTPGTAHQRGSAGRLKTPRSAEMAERNIKSFLGSIFPSRRVMGVRVRCPHCGAPFKDEKAKDAHYRYHFHNHNVMRGEDRVVRLSYPSPDDFVVHLGDLDQSGYYPQATELLEEAYKNGEKGVFKARRLDGNAPKARGNGE